MNNQQGNQFYQQNNNIQSNNMQNQNNQFQYQQPQHSQQQQQQQHHHQQQSGNYGNTNTNMGMNMNNNMGNMNNINNNMGMNYNNTNNNNHNNLGGMNNMNNMNTMNNNNNNNINFPNAQQAAALLGQDPTDPWNQPPSQVELFRSIKAFGTADTLHDVQITSDEFDYFGKSKLAPHITQQLIQFCDRDHDNILSPAEFVLCMILHIRIRTSPVLPTQEQVNILYPVVHEECQLNKEQFPPYAQERLIAPFHLPQNINNINNQQQQGQNWADDFAANFDSILGAPAPQPMQQQQQQQQQQHMQQQNNLARMTGQPHSSLSQHTGVSTHGNMNVSSLSQHTGVNTHGNMNVSSLSRMTGQNQQGFNQNFTYAGQQPPTPSNAAGSNLAQMTGTRGRRGTHVQQQQPQQQQQQQFQQQQQQQPSNQKATFDMFENLVQSTPVNNNMGSTQVDFVPNFDDNNNNNNNNSGSFNQQQFSANDKMQALAQQEAMQRKIQAEQEQQKVNMEAIIQKQQAEIDEKQNVINQLQLEISEKSANLSTLRHQQSELQDQQMAAAINLSESQNTLNDLLQEYNALESSIATLSQQLEQYTTEVQQLDTSIQQNREDIEVFTLQQETLTNQVTEIKTQFEQKVDENQAMYQQTQTLQASIESLQETKAHYDQELAKMDDFDAEVARLEAQRNDIKIVVDGLSVQVESRKADYEYKQQQKVGIMAETQSLEQQQQDLLAKQAELELSCDNEAKAVREAWLKIEELKKSFIAAQTKLDTISTNNNDDNTNDNINPEQVKMATNFVELALQLLQLEPVNHWANYTFPPQQQSQQQPTPSQQQQQPIPSQQQPQQRPQTATVESAPQSGLDDVVSIPVVDIATVDSHQSSTTVEDPPTTTTTTTTHDESAVEVKAEPNVVEEPVVDVVPEPVVVPEPETIIDDDAFDAFDDEFDFGNDQSQQIQTMQTQTASSSGSTGGNDQHATDDAFDVEFGADFDNDNIIAPVAIVNVASPQPIITPQQDAPGDDNDFAAGFDDIAFDDDDDDGADVTATVPIDNNKIDEKSNEASQADTSGIEATENIIIADNQSQGNESSHQNDEVQETNTNAQDETSQPPPSQETLNDNEQTQPDDDFNPFADEDDEIKPNPVEDNDAGLLFSQPQEQVEEDTTQQSEQNNEQNQGSMVDSDGDDENEVEKNQDDNNNNNNNNNEDKNESDTKPTEEANKDTIETPDDDNLWATFDF